MATVHLTMFEDPIEVPDDEVPVLYAQGLIRPEVAPTPAVTPASAVTLAATPPSKKEAQA